MITDGVPDGVPGTESGMECTRYADEKNMYQVHLKSYSNLLLQVVMGKGELLYAIKELVHLLA
ncbi:hypothetical protein GCM10010954_26130 [Halobacillus andaensis]|uniref:Uncharacterized protein n=1 Tax=Halobacillus andaensis TaxID=1176239 RepID=A0A917B5P5_HALAA|nr:hypothetical protein GCM10010954_26130 [Halobacillus andaensis]